MSRRGLKRKRGGNQTIAPSGSDLAEESYQYYECILKTFREGFATDTERDLFVNNALKKTSNQELKCACDRKCSRVLEALLPVANQATFKRFMKNLATDLRALSTDVCGSHVLDMMVSEANRRSNIWVSKRSDLTNKYQAFVVKVGRFLLNNIHDFIWNSYANPTMRTVLRNLANIPNEDGKMRAHEQQILQDFEVSESNQELIMSYAQTLLEWPQFNELANSELSSVLLQVLLTALAKVNKSEFKKFVKRLIKEVLCPDDETPYDENNLPPVFLNMASTRLLEAIITSAKKKLLAEIYKSCFKGMICKLSVTNATKFAVQKLINCIGDAEQFEAIFDELLDKFRLVFDAGHEGLIYSLGQTCKRLSTRQGSFHLNLLKALDCLEPKERQQKFIICLCKLSPYDQIDPAAFYDGEQLNILGTLILQLLLAFEKPIHLVEQLLNMNKDELKHLLSNSMGCHITDAFVSSQYVGEKNRKKLINVLKGTYQDLAASRYGSRTFDSLWKVAGMENRMEIMAELEYKDGLWIHSEFGKIVANKVHYSLYTRNKKQWQLTITNVDKKFQENLAKHLREKDENAAPSTSKVTQ